MMKANLRCIILLILTLVIGASCGTHYRKSNLTDSQVYLQSVSSTEGQTAHYGYSISEPITLKLSEAMNYDDIIDEYIGRIHFVFQSKDGIIVQDVIIEKREALPIEDYKVQKSKSKLVNDLSRVIHVYTLRSEDGSKRVSLYFSLDSKAKEFGYPSGFFYGKLAG